MLAQIDPQALAALRVAATFFFIVNLLGGAYIFRNRHRFFDRDPNVDNDIPAVRRIRVEVIMIPWLILTTLVLILLKLSGLLEAVGRCVERTADYGDIGNMLAIEELTARKTNC